MKKVFFERSKKEKHVKKRTKDGDRKHCNESTNFHFSAEESSMAPSSSSESCNSVQNCNPEEFTREGGKEKADSSTEMVQSFEKLSNRCVQDIWLANDPFDTVIPEEIQSKRGTPATSINRLRHDRRAKSPEMSDYFEKHTYVANVFCKDSKLLRKLFWFKEKEAEQVKEGYLTTDVIKLRKALHFSHMFSYLSKKLDMPEGSKVTSVAWSGMDGYLACGCNTGLLKVLKIEVVKPSSSSWSQGYLAAPTTIVKNQTLAGHSAPIVAIDWNQRHKKLTSTDKKGLTIVWKCCRGAWCEEMVHNREGFAVRTFSWSACGSKICIVYEDGGVMVGSSEGRRLWGHEMVSDSDSGDIVGTAWEPNGAHVVFLSGRGTLYVYDAEGQMQKQIQLRQSYIRNDGFRNNMTDEDQLVLLRWHNNASGSGYVRNVPSLALVWARNFVCFSVSLDDKEPIIAESQMTMTCGMWSPNGEFFAVGGRPLVGSEVAANGKTYSYEQINIFSPFGTLLQSIKIPGSACVSLSWDALSLRLAVGIGENIYFANVRPCYMFCFLDNQLLVYSFNRPDGTACIGFWNVEDDRFSKQEIPGKVVDIKGVSDVCAILCLATTGCYNATIINNRGDPVDSITMVATDPFMINLTDSVVTAISKNAITIWRYEKNVGGAKSVVPRTCGDFMSKKRIRSFHIDDTPTMIGETGEERRVQEKTDDSVRCADARCQMLIVCRKSGKLQIYSLPHGALMNTIDTAYEMNFQPSRLWLNMDCSQVAMIDKQGHLSVCSLGSASIKTALARKLDRKDVWNLVWADDHPNLICVMEKTKMYMIRNGDSEEPILTSAYLASLKDLTLTSILLDELMFNPEEPRGDLIIVTKTQTLTEAHKLVSSRVALETLHEFVVRHDHVKLWQIFGNECLRDMELELAESSFAKAKDYYGISFVKKLSLMSDPGIRQAEIAQYFQDYDGADKIYQANDRRDLAREMWRLVGDWKKVEQGSGREKASDAFGRQVALEKGEVYFDRGDWGKAGKYFESGGDMTKVVDSYLMGDDFTKLCQLIDSLHAGDPLLLSLAKILETRGLCDYAVKAMMKHGKKGNEEVIQAAIRLSQWDLALEIADAKDNNRVEELLVKCIANMLHEGKSMDAVALLLKSNKSYAAGKLLVIIALDQLQEEETNLVQVKKFFVHAAKMLQHKVPTTSTVSLFECKKHDLMSPKSLKKGEIGSSLTSPDLLFEHTLPENMRPSREMYVWIRDAPWRGAEAVHYFILAQKYLHQGEYLHCLRICVQILRAFVDILGKERINSIMGIAAANMKNFFYSSMAFMELESLPNGDSEYSDLAAELFSCVMSASEEHQAKKNLHEPKWLTKCYICGFNSTKILASCPECCTAFRLCAMTGRVMDSKFWSCSICKYDSDFSSVRSLRYCPFCHSERLSSVENLTYDLA